MGFELIADNAVEKIKNCFKKSFESDMPKHLTSLCEREDIRSGIYYSQNDEDVERVSFETSF